MAELASQPTSIQSLYNWYREEKLFVNRRYQRKLVWTQIEKQKLIESILKKYPIPAILIAERDAEPGTFEIIDGLQRLHSIISYIENAFPLENGNFFNIDHFPTARGAANDGAFIVPEDVPLIVQREVSVILDYSLALSVMRNASEAEINDVFDRINTYGHRLSDQERRQAGVQNEFSTVVREIACDLRGDATAEVLPLSMMPTISIDLPKAKHGYEVRAEDVFWVKQGILRSTDLRDSLDEQYVADIVACISSGELIERSKDALDEIYNKGSANSEAILNGLEIYGSKIVADELKFCISELLKVCSTEPSIKLRDLIFERRTSNAFPSVFAVILLAFHEIIVKEKKKISNYQGVKDALRNVASRIDTSRRATSSDERRKNVNSIKGLIGSCFVSDSKIGTLIYNNHNAIDIETVIRRSEIETGCYELKQGLLLLKKGGTEDPNIIEKVVNTICAIANIGPNSSGKIIIGVTDKKSDADQVFKVDNVTARSIGNRYVVGVSREASRVGIKPEAYFSKWKNGIKNSELSQSVKNDVLSNIDYNNFYGLGLIVITVPPQKELSYVGEYLYWRNGDSTEIATTPKQIAAIAKRF